MPFALGSWRVLPARGPLGEEARLRGEGVSPEARSGESTHPSRTWRGWHSRSPKGPGRSCGSSTPPRCHCPGCCGGSPGRLVCLRVGGVVSAAPAERGQGARRGLGGPAPGPPSWTEHGHSLRVPRPRVAWEMGSPTFQDRRSRDTSAPLSQTLRQVGMGGGRRRREERSEDLKHRTLLSSRPPLAPPGSKSQPPGKAPSTSVSGPGGGGGGAPSKGSVMGPMGGAGPSTPSGSHSLGEGQQLPDPTVPLPAPKEAGDRGRAQARQAAGAWMDGRIRNAFQREAWKPPSLALGGPFLRGVSGGWGAECLRGVPGPGVTGRGGAGLPSPAPPGGGAPPGRGPCTLTPTSNVCFGSHWFPTPFIKSPI